MAIESLKPGEASCESCFLRARKQCPYRGLARFSEYAAAERHDCTSFKPVGVKSELRRRYAGEQAPDQPGLF